MKRYWKCIRCESMVVSGNRSPLLCTAYLKSGKMCFGPITELTKEDYVKDKLKSRYEAIAKSKWFKKAYKDMSMEDIINY